MKKKQQSAVLGRVPIVLVHVKRMLSLPVG